MAYAATVSSPTITVVNGRRHFRWTISEVEAATSSEFIITGAPQIGTLVLYNATRTAGTGTTINPLLGRAAAFASGTQNHIATNATTAAHIGDASNVRYSGLVSGEIFVRNNPNNVTADHSISTEIVIVEGVI
jgi:hypothetical protein